MKLVDMQSWGVVDYVRASSNPVVGTIFSENTVTLIITPYNIVFFK